MSDQNSGDSLLDMFIFETTQNTEQLEKNILETEKNGVFSQSAINEIFRIMHTIKGSSSMMAYSHIASLAHKAEDLFYFLRENAKVSYDCSLITDLILSFTDYINKELINIEEKKEPDFNGANQLIKKFDNYLNELQNEHNSELFFYKIVIYFVDGCKMENIRAYSIINDISEFSIKIEHIPDNVFEDDSTALKIRDSGFTIFFETTKSYEEVLNHFKQTPFIRDFDLAILDNHGLKTECDVDSNNKENAVITELKTENHQAHSIISINVTKLDKLMNLVGEAVISESMVVENPDLKGLELQSFQREAQHLHKIIVEMQDLVMTMRLVPIITTFQKTHRIVRDMSKKLGKDVRIEFVGEDTEVDKNIIEHLSDPLLHLVRNCIDHGLESEEERIAAGKPATGTITLEAYNAGSNVYIIVKDDGKGLSKEKILKRAKKNNLLTKPESEMSDKDILNLIYMPGFSTKEAVSEYSGRGVGMDVVMQNILSVGGAVSVDSEEGKGTSIILKIPLTVAIIEGMNLMVGNKRFTLPISAIRESFKIEEKNIFKDNDGNQMIMIRGQCYGVIRLYKQWDIETDIKDLTDGIIVMVEQDEKRRCIFVDSLLGQQQVVVKTIPDYIRNYGLVEGFSGCTLLGDGSISLILDAGWLVNTDIK